MKTKFFSTPAEFRNWLETHHKTEEELWVGFYKTSTGIPSITWPQSVDQALCFGWIDGLRQSIDKKSYRIRFTPRRADSNWSERNLKRVEELIRLEQMDTSGLLVYRKRKASQSPSPSKIAELSPRLQEKFLSNPEAWQYFQGLAPSVRKLSIGWVMSAKKEETKLKRLETLINSSQNKEKIPPLRIGKK